MHDYPHIPNILILTDEAKRLFCLQEQLKKQDFKIISAILRDDFLDIIKEECPKVIVLDIETCTCKISNFINILKEDPSTVGIPLIIVSYFLDQQLIRQLIHKKVEKFICKPYHFSEVLAGIHSQIYTVLEPVLR